MKKLATFLVLALAATALVACGGDDNGNGDGNGNGAVPTDPEAVAPNGDEATGGSTVSFESAADDGLAYTTDEATAEAGEVTIEYTNEQSLPHDVAIEDANGEQIGATEVVTDGEASTTVNLEPGEYTFYCSVPGHREGGMEGTLTVE